MSVDAKLTRPQQAFLDRLRASVSPVVQNGRARRTILALEAAGLITYDFDLVPCVKGYTERYTCEVRR